jgi:hypothetical protein
MKSRRETTKAASKSSARSSANQNSRLMGPTVEEIRLRAYELYVDRGRADGQDLADWYQAAKELTEIIRKRESA